ncbi:hypothetical protein SteCoe_29423 [Stentor coeruleus]|uniref:Uncharacterized protein n=1 Tax=Stentor coeruleus TaxID=5963 RepID=A0A1R2B5Z8_9CILI|nr:hypothetical protein SteCoe_29423 [Stentor coeruleus]
MDFLCYGIENSDLVDALAYVDEYSENDEIKAKKMVEEEMKNFEMRDYLVKYKECYKEREVGGFVAMNLNTRSPSTPYEALSLSNTHKIILEHLETQKLNLELSNTYSDLAWKKHITSLESYEKSLDHNLNQLEKSTEDLHKSRKIHQSQVKSELKNLEEEFKVLVGKNASIYKKLQEKKEILQQLKNNST